MNGRTRTVFAIVRFITDNPAERGAVEGEKAIANGFTIEGLIAAAPLRKTELSRRTRRKRRPSGVGAIIFMYAGSTIRRREMRQRSSETSLCGLLAFFSVPFSRVAAVAIKIPRSLLPLLGIISFH